MLRTLDVGQILALHVPEPTARLRHAVNGVVQPYIPALRNVTTDVRELLGNVFATLVRDITWFQEGAYIGSIMVDRGLSAYGIEPEAAGLMVRNVRESLQVAEVEAMQAQVRAGIERTFAGRLEVRIKQAISNPGLYSTKLKLQKRTDVPGGGRPVRGKLRRDADELGRRPPPLDRRTGEGMGRDKDADE